MSKELTLRVTFEHVGWRLDKFLALHESIQTRSRAAFLINKELVFVNKKKSKASQQIKSDDEILIFMPEPEATDLKPLNQAIDFLYEDEDLVVINKPANLVVHPAAGHAQDTLVNMLLHHSPNWSMKFGENRPGIVHRLDKDTSGILVVAKNDFTQEGLALQFKNRSIERHYLAVVMGSPPYQSASIKSYLARHPTERKKFSSLRDENKKIIRTPDYETLSGKWAHTDYQVLKSHDSGLFYLKLKLQTGRTHQIRVHLSEAGCPILKDDTYGAKKKMNSFSVKWTKSFKELIESCPRFALHAAELGFIHPRTNKKHHFEVTWPDDLKPILKELNFLN